MSARPVPSSGTTEQTAGCSDTLRSERATGPTADKAMAKRSLPECLLAPNASGRGGGEGRGGTPT